MGFNLTPNTSSSSISVNADNPVITTQVTGWFMTTSELVHEYVLSNHKVEASLKLIKLKAPWPELQVQLSKQYEPYQ